MAHLVEAVGDGAVPGRIVLAAVFCGQLEILLDGRLHLRLSPLLPRILGIVREEGDARALEKRVHPSSHVRRPLVEIDPFDLLQFDHSLLITSARSDDVIDIVVFPILTSTVFTPHSTLAKAMVGGTASEFPVPLLPQVSHLVVAYPKPCLVFLKPVPVRIVYDLLLLLRERICHPSHPPCTKRITKKRGPNTPNFRLRIIPQESISSFLCFKAKKLRQSTTFQNEKSICYRAL